MSITDFALWMHLLVSLLRMCYQESEQTKASDMEDSGHWDWTVFSCIHRKHVSPLFSSPWVGSAPVPTRCVENGHPISQPGRSLEAVDVRPRLPSLPALRCSISGWRLRANWNPSKTGEVLPIPTLSEVCPDLSSKWMSPHSDRNSPQALARPPIQLSVLFTP